MTKKLRDYHSGRLLLALVAGWTAVLAIFAITRHERLNSSAYDLAIKSQVIWNTSQGRMFASSMEVGHYLGDHVQLIFLLLAPLYRLYPDVRLLLLIQAAALSIGAIPIYRITLRELGNSVIAIAFSIVYLLYPTIGFINRFDFHPIAFTIPLFLFAIDALEISRYRLASGLLLIALMCKEEVGLTIFALGLYVALARKQRGLGALWAGVGLAWSLAAFFVIIPYFRHGASDTAFRYAWLGTDIPTIIHTLLTRPGYVILHQLGAPFRQRFLLRLLLPVGYLSLLAPATLLIALPCLGYNLLSDIPSQSSIYFQYISPFVPFAFIAAIKGAKRVQRWSQQGKFLILILLTVGTVTAWLLDNPFTHPIREPYYPVYALEKQPGGAAFAEARQLIPPQASLATTMAYAPHFSTRPELDLFYHQARQGIQVYNFTRADYLLLNLTDLRWNNPRMVYAMIETAIGLDGYEAIYFRDDVALLTREAAPHPETGAVLQRVIALEEAGGKHVPTGQETMGWLASQWLYSALPPAAHSLEARFEMDLALLGYQRYPASTVAPGDSLCVTLFWHPQAAIASSYAVFVHLADETGYVHAQRDNIPVLGFYPTHAWQPDQLIGDMHCFRVPPPLPLGDYGLTAGIYDPTSGTRLDVENEDSDSRTDMVLLTSLTIESK